MSGTFCASSALAPVVKAKNIAITPIIDLLYLFCIFRVRSFSSLSDFRNGNH